MYGNRSMRRCPPVAMLSLINPVERAGSLGSEARIRAADWLTTETTQGDLDGTFSDITVRRTA